MKYINSWVKNIIFVVIVSGIIEMILPEGKSKKYIKVVIGVYIIFVIINPILSIFSKDKIDLNSIIDKYEKNISKYNMNAITLDTNEYINKIYKEKIKEEITAFINKEGYDVESVDIGIYLSDDEQYGKIENISLRIFKEEEKDKEENKNEDNNLSNKNEEVKKIEKIKINISNTNNVEENRNAKSELSKNEINRLKEKIKKEYEIAIEKIHINE